jgi:hypothetical protein
MVELADIRQRVFDMKEEIRISTHHIIDMAVDYESIYSRENIKQIKKEINNIMSCLAELKPYASLFEKRKVSKIEKVGIYIIASLGGGLVTTGWLDVFCVAVNSIEVKPTKKSVEIAVGGNLRGLKLLMSKEESNF